jgi:hypothetical protein
MKMGRAILTLTVFWALFAHYDLLAGDNELLRLWSAPGASVRERADAVNRAFTNGTPIMAVVAVLGTNYTTFEKPYSGVWMGPGAGPEPGQNLAMIYAFGDDEVYIWTKEPKNLDPLTGKFTSAEAITPNWWRTTTNQAPTGLPSSPSESGLKKMQSDYDAALADATNSIPYAADFARLFPGAASYFSYYIGGAGPSSLNTEVLFFDRYKLSMNIPVTFDATRRKVRSFGKPEWSLVEFSEVTKERRVGSLGPVEILRSRTNPEGQRRFGAKEWKKIVEARGDFSAVGFPLITNSPAPGFEDLRKDWEMRMKKQP